MNRAAVFVVVFLLAMTLGRSAPADPVPRVTERSGIQTPFTETMADMARRDLQWKREVEAGLRPAPPRQIRIGGHGAHKVRKKPSRQAFELFLPAVFLPPRNASTPDHERRFLAPQAKGASFPGVSLQDQYNAGTGFIPPDTCGAIGPDHFVEVINGSVAVFNRTGTRLSYVSLTSFLAAGIGGTNYPRGYAFDPRIVYDRRSGRWFVTGLELNSASNNHVILAVSRTADPTAVWDKYLLMLGKPPEGDVSYFTDYPTLGVDDNGVYVPASVFSSSGGLQIRIAATRKAPLLGSPPSMGPVYFIEDPDGFYSTPQPALNLDAVQPTDPAWFVSSSPDTYSDMRAARLSWSETGGPTLDAVTNLPLPEFDYPPPAPAQGSTINIDTGDMRMQPAMIREGRLFAARHIGVNGVGGAVGADRTAVEWMELDVSTPTPSIVQSGRLYDAAASDPVFFFYPSLAANGLGQLAVSFSDSSGARWVAAETCGRLASDQSGTLRSIMQIVPGQNQYTLKFSGSDNRWGDYSHTSVDPSDDLSIWTIQEYATATKNVWGTWIAQLTAPPPTLDNPGGTGQAGESGVILDLTGAGIYDPGQGFPNRLSVELTGGAVNGIGAYAVTFNDPTSVRVVFDIAADASAGPRDIVLTNPDGQQAIVTDGFTVTRGQPTTMTVSDASGSVGETVELLASLKLSDDDTPIGGKPVRFTVEGTEAGVGNTDDLGRATCSYAIPETPGSGDWRLEASFAGDADYRASVAAGTMSVAKAATTMYVPARTGTISEPVTLRGYVRRAADNVWIDHRTLVFSIDGSEIGSAVSGATGTPGRADLTWIIAEGPGSRSISVTCSEDAAYTGSTGTATLTCQSWETGMASFDRTARITDRTELKCRLLRSDNAPLYNKSVNFYVDGTFIITRPTNVDGYAGYPFYDVPDGAGAGTRTILSEWPGNGGYAAISKTATLTVLKAIPYVWVLPKSVPQGSIANLYAYFRRLYDYQKQEGKTVDFKLDGTAIQTVVTGSGDQAGIARYLYPTTEPQGVYTIRCEFYGDAYVEPGYGEASLTVY